MATAGRRNLLATWEAATIGTVMREMQLPRVRTIVEANMLDIAIETNGAPPWALIHQAFPALRGSLVGNVQEILRKHGMRISSLDGPLADHWTGPVIWCYTSRTGRGRSDVPRRQDHRPGFVATPRGIYDKLRTRAPQGRLVTIQDTLTAPSRLAMRRPRTIPDGVGAVIMGMWLRGTTG